MVAIRNKQLRYVRNFYYLLTLTIIFLTSHEFSFIFTYEPCVFLCLHCFKVRCVNFWSMTTVSVRTTYQSHCPKNIFNNLPQNLKKITNFTV